MTAVHEAQLVHGDVKPGNVFVVSPSSDQGEPNVKLLDFGLVKRVATVNDMVREAASLAAAAATKTLFHGEIKAAGPKIMDVQRRIWLHSLTSALGASWLAMECSGDSQKAFLGGMLHDIGKTLALRAFVELKSLGKLGNTDPAHSLTPVLEATHVELGERMAQEWKLPAHVVRVCAEHHSLKTTVREDRELHLIRVASGIAAMRLDPDWPLHRMDEVQESASALGMDRFRLRATSAQIRELAAKAEALARATSANLH